VLRAAARLVEAEAAVPVLLGSRETIRGMAAEHGISLKFINVIEPAKSSDLGLFCQRFAKVERYRKLSKSPDKTNKLHLDVAEKLVALLGDGKPARAGDWTEEERASVKEAQLITAKPVLYVCNVDEGGLEGNAYTAQVEALAATQGAMSVNICAKVEAEISELDPADRASFLADLGLAEPGLARLARSTYTLLGLQTYFTAGPKEIRAWTIERGWKAPQAAGVIHTDFERGFIRAEVYTVTDLLALKSEAALKSAGKMRVEGKEYIVQDGDVMHFRFNV
jgi:GTP-binding protein YchF